MSDDKYTLLLKEAEQRFKDELDRRDKVVAVRPSESALKPYPQTLVFRITQTAFYHKIFNLEQLSIP